MTWLIRRASISGFFLGHFLFAPAPVYSLRVCVVVQGFCKKKKNYHKGLFSSAVPTSQALIAAPTQQTYTFASQVTPDAGSAAAADNKSLPSDSIV